jgi:TonB-dependent SusC/RagA subfamily outer membrane receptor
VSIKINKVIESRRSAHDGSDSYIENDALKLKEAFNEKYLSGYVFTDEVSGKVVGSDDRLPVVGASVRVKGTARGAVTDVNGNFHLKTPENGKLIVSYIGYITKEIPLEQGKRISILLTPASSSLNEVVVTGYNTQLRKDITGSVSVINGLTGVAAGIMVTDEGGVKIRGIGELPGQAPLYIVDGVPVKGLAGLNPGQVQSISVLKSAAAVGLYGAAAANGVVIIITNKQTADKTPVQGAPADTSQALRKNFSDYAYWQPKLNTDENGRASFISTFPDDITNWRTFVAAINANRQSGFTEGSIKSFKPLSANFISPLFAVAGDELSAIGKISNYNADKARVNRTFNYNGQRVKADSLEVDNAKIDTLHVTATATDSLTFEYSIKRSNGYFDGERRQIPVVKAGVEETSGQFAALNHDTTVTMRFDPSLGRVTFHAEASLLPVLLNEAEKLRDYKYLCNEQLASKLKGLLVEKQVSTYLCQPFKYEKNVHEAIRKIEENRRSGGGWGWWKDTDEELWISLHAVEALEDARNMGYSVDLDGPKLIDYLVYQLESYRGEDKITCLRVLRKLKAKVDYPKYIGVIQRELAGQKNVPMYDKLSLVLLTAEAGLPVKLDSLLAWERHTMFGNIYWGEENNRFFDNSVQLSILAYKILALQGGHDALLEKIRGYFLEQRAGGQWRNTYESALILETILPDLLKNKQQVTAPAITVKGSQTTSVDKFPYTASLTDNQITINKSGDLPVYITGYQQYWNPAPAKVDKNFTVDTWFEKDKAKLTRLKGGETVTLKAEVNVKGDADYVMIEIPIPAGCSYEDKEQSWQNGEVHREYFKEKVSIFCRKLKQGKYTFEVHLMPRFSGLYTLNPAKAEMMYFPVFYGREGIKKVKIAD